MAALGSFVLSPTWQLVMMLVGSYHVHFATAGTCNRIALNELSLEVEAFMEVKVRQWILSFFMLMAPDTMLKKLALNVGLNISWMNEYKLSTGDTGFSKPGEGMGTTGHVSVHNNTRILGYCDWLIVRNQEMLFQKSMWLCRCVLLCRKWACCYQSTTSPCS